MKFFYDISVFLVNSFKQNQILSGRLVHSLNAVKLQIFNTHDL